jgi:hypothetical protein
MIYVFLTHVASVFICTLHMFYTYVASVLFGCLRMVAMFFKCFQVFFVQVFQKHVSIAFRRMLQLLYLDVSKVDRVLHLSSPPSATLSLPASTGHPYDAAAGSFRIGGASHPSPLVAQVAWAPRGARKRPSGRPALALP